MGRYAQRQSQAQQPDSSNVNRPIKARQGPEAAQHPLLQLQQAIGNQAVLRRLPLSRPVIQAKLTINRPGDSYEQEADRVADQVTRAPEAHAPVALSGGGAAVQRKCECGGTCAGCRNEHREDERGHLQTKRAGSAGAELSEAPPVVHRALHSPAQPLDRPSRAYFEPRLGYDLSEVRVHTGGLAAASARSVNAQAYTVGNDVVFGAGRFQPGTSEGRRLLAHELVHVIQQAGVAGAGPVLARQPAEAAPEEDLEEAEENLRDVIVPVRPAANQNAQQAANQNAPTNETETEPAQNWRPDPNIEPQYAYSDQGARTDWSGAANFRQAQIEAGSLRYNLEATPRAVATPGGSAPDFVTVEPPQVHQVTNDEAFVWEELKGGSVRFRPRDFHLPDAMEHDLGLVTTPDEWVGVFLAYFPETAFGGDVSLRADLRAQPGAVLPGRFKAPNGRIYRPTLPHGATIGRLTPAFDFTPIDERIALFDAADDAVRARRVKAEKERARAAVLAEAEKVALEGTKRREGACDSKRTVAKGGNAEHDEYAAHVARENGYARIRGGRTEMTWTTPEAVSYAFDTFNPANVREVWEVKTQHEWTSPLGMAEAPYHVKGGLHERIYALEGQRLKGIYVAVRCGLAFRWAVDNCEAYNGLTQAWAGLPPVRYIPPAGKKKVPC